MNYQETEQKNVFVQIAEGWRSFWDAFSGSSENVEGTFYDDAARVIKFVLFFASVATGISYTFSNHIFFGWLGEPLSWYPALLLAVVLELAMVFIGFVFFRGLAKKTTWYELPAIAVVVSLGIVFFFACRWGYTLSSEGQGQLSIMFAQKQAEKDTTYVNTTIDPRLVDINAQLDKLNGNIDQQNGALGAAYSIKWKKKTTEKGQQLADQAGTNLNTLSTTQAMLLSEKLRIEAAQDSTEKAQRRFNVSTQAQWTTLFGGYMEIFKIGCIAALAFCAVGVENYRALEEQGQNASPTLQSGAVQSKRIGFAYGQNKPHAILQNTVVTGSNSVTTPITVQNFNTYFDEKIKSETQNIQAWVSKLRNKQGKITTAQENILKRLEAVNAAMNEYYLILEKTNAV